MGESGPVGSGPAPAGDAGTARSSSARAGDSRAATVDDPTAGAADELDGGDEVPAGNGSGFRLAAFGAVLILVLFAGYGLGRLNNGVVSASAPATGAANGTATGAAAGGGAMPGMAVNENQPHVHNIDGTATQSGMTMPAGGAVGGLSLSSGGLTLVPTRTTFAAGTRGRLEFRIAGTGGAPVTTYAVVHDKTLHLVVVRRDLSGFQHLHPTMAADGTWGIDLTLAEPGIYRMIADFTAVVGGQPIATTLGSDLTVSGNYAPRELPAPVRAVSVDGFAVGYEGAPDTKSSQPILVSVAGADRQPARLEPYLGAFGHLVVVRQGDLAYVHVHPETQLVDGKVKFWLSMPSAGTYRMFFDFQVDGKVHTAAWTATIA